jgi:hypothetical protein
MNNRLNTSGAAEQEFARRLCARLDDAALAIDDAKLEKLAFARKLALRAQVNAEPRIARVARPVFGLAAQGMAFAGGSSGTGRLSGPGRFGISFAVIGLVFVCLFGIFQVEQQRRIDELADIDSQLLSSDDVPIAAYADHGFNAFLKQNP